MVTRRTLLTGGALAGIAGGAGVAGETDSLRAESADEDRIAKALEEIRDELRRQRGDCSPAVCAEVNSIRAQQRTFLKGRGKFPDFIDVGIDVWESLYDWHTRANLKPEVSRSLDGRLQMAFMQTLLVLRHDMPGSHVGLGYDGKEGQDGAM